jgi:DNA-dependent RNA polymerase auxiliary subunit epsilon
MYQEANMKKSTDTFYWNYEKQERVRVVYRVELVMPGWFYGRVDVEADSEEDAARIALDERLADVEWVDSNGGDDSAAEVMEVFCDDPPADAILIGKNPSNASLDFLFEAEDEAPEKGTTSALGHEAQTNAADGGQPCK